MYIVQCDVIFRVQKDLEERSQDQESKIEDMAKQTVFMCKKAKEYAVTCNKLKVCLNSESHDNQKSGSIIVIILLFLA